MTLAEVLVYVVNLFALLGVLLAVGVLSGMQLWNACSNITTIEGYEIDRVRHMVDRGEMEDVRAIAALRIAQMP